MCRKRIDDSDQQLQVLPPEQPFLFTSWPEEPERAEAVKRYAHTGMSLANDPRCRDIVEAILNGASPRAVAAHYHVGRETLAAFFKHLSEAGKLGPFKERLAKQWQSIAELAGWRLEESLVRGDMPLQVLPMLKGIATDKILLLTHSMPEETPQKTIDITPERISRVLAILDGAPPSVDTSSTDSACKPLAANACRDDDTVGDTPTPPTESSGPPTPGGAADSAMSGGGDRDSVAGRDG